MKIPLYQSKTQLGADSGARSLTATASPGQYGKLGDLASQAGASMLQGGQALSEIAIAEKRQESATLLANETSAFQAELFATQTRVITDPVGESRSIRIKDNPERPGPRAENVIRLPETQFEHLARVQRDLQRTIKSQASRIKNRNVRRAFVSDATTKLATAMPGMRQQLRLRYLDRHRAAMSDADKAARQNISTLSGVGRASAIERHISRIRDAGAINYETEVNIAKRIDDFRSAVDEDSINAAAFEASRLGQKLDAATGLPAYNEAGETMEVVAYRGIIADIEDGKYPNLDSDKKIKLLESLRKKQDAARRRFDSLMNRVGVRTERERRKKQLLNFEDLSARIAAVQDATARGEVARDSKGNEITMPTVTDFVGTHITDAQRTVLERQLAGEDRIFNQDLYLDYVGQVDEAVTDGDLTAIYDSALQDRLAGRIGGKALTAIKTKVDAYKLKTPAALEQKRYLSILKTALGAHEGSILSGVGAEKADLHNKAEALSLYQRLLGEGVRPEVAYLETVKRFDYEQSKLGGAMIRGLPSGIAHGFKVIGTGEIDTRQMTKEQAVAGLRAIEKHWANALNAMAPKTGYELVDPKMRATKEQLGERQRLTDKAQRLPKSARMRIRDLYALEKRMQILNEIVGNIKTWKVEKPAEQGDNKADERSWWERWTGDDDSENKPPKNMRKQ